MALVFLAPSLRSLLTACLAMALVSCGTVQPGKATTTFVVVRHAEKAADDPRDPSLSEAGNARAQALARVLADAPLVAVYATDYRRTQQTARPAADAHGVEVTSYDANSPTELASRLRATHHRGTVLVVGHSNTAPQLASALSGHATAPMPDDEFGRIYRVTVAADGTATLVVDHY